VVAPVATLDIPSGRAENAPGYEYVNQTEAHYKIGMEHSKYQRNSLLKVKKN